MKVCDMPTKETPQYRAEHFGTTALSKAELLQVICRNHDLEANYTLINQAKTLSRLAQMTPEEIAATPGIGKKGALAIRAALDLGTRLAIESTEDHPVIRSPSDIGMLLMPQLKDLEQEHFVVLFLDTRNRVIGQHTLYIGCVNAIHIRVAEIFKKAVRTNAVAIVVAHNHPSGDPAPSPEDVAITLNIKEAGDLLEIELLDHVIVGKQRFVSLRERGLGGLT